jgi:hypothetical protein
LPWHSSSAEAWLESYAGGWQLLCPNAGGTHVRGGVEQGFHGEAALLPWAVEASTAATAQLHVQLFTAPLDLRRELCLDGPVLVVTDTVTNDSPVAVEFDFQHHPAFGRPLLGPDCVIETDAASYVLDPAAARSAGAAQPGLPTPWPPVIDESGLTLDRLSATAEPRGQLGWLTGFPGEGGWAALRNPSIDLAVGLSWDPAVLPHAWLWQELANVSGFPWFGRAYVMAIEPSSTTQSGPGRAQTMTLAAGASRSVTVCLTACRGSRPIAAIDRSGQVRFDTTVDSDGRQL